MPVQEDEERRARREAKRWRWQRAQEAAREHRDRVLSLREWCALNGFSLATGRRILGGAGPKPRVLQLSARRIGIRESDNADWQSRVQAQA
jgi:predicted DNA-binding transcriptional regulator AlpA